jgi:hypothetical protein
MALFDKFVGRDKKQQLPKNIQDYLTENFNLRREDLIPLQWVARKELFDGDPANFVRIYSGTKTQEKGVTINNFDDLNNHPDLVLFEGHVFGGKAMNLERKTPIKKEAGST